MRLNTAKFGQIEVDERKIVRFASPILGFADHTEYALLEHPATSPIYWLQAVQCPDLAFPVIDPFLLVPEYDFEVSSSLLDELKAENVEDLCTLTVVVITRNMQDIRTNLRAPILYNPDTGLAKQIVLEGTDYPVQHYFGRQQQGAA